MAVLEKGLYQHYKGPLYKVLDVVAHSETEEFMVLYQALYGEKGLWVRPLSMFTETVIVAGDTGANQQLSQKGATREVPRFSKLDLQTEVLEVWAINIDEGSQSAFEHAFSESESVLASIDSYISHSLTPSLTHKGQYLLQITWQALELEGDEQGLRHSAKYLQWKKGLDQFSKSLPDVQYFRGLAL